MAKLKKDKSGFAFFGIVSGEELRHAVISNFAGKTITERAQFNTCLQSAKIAEVNGKKVSKALLLGYLSDGKNSLSGEVIKPKETREGSIIKVSKAINLDKVIPCNYLSR